MPLLSFTYSFLFVFRIGDTARCCTSAFRLQWGGGRRVAAWPNAAQRRVPNAVIRYYGGGFDGNHKRGMYERAHIILAG